MFITLGIHTPRMLGQEPMRPQTRAVVLIPEPSEPLGGLVKAETAGQSGMGPENLLPVLAEAIGLGP